MLTSKNLQLVVTFTFRSLCKKSEVVIYKSKSYYYFSKALSLAPSLHGLSCWCPGGAFKTCGTSKVAVWTLKCATRGPAQFLSRGTCQYIRALVRSTWLRKLALPPCDRQIYKQGGMTGIRTHQRLINRYCYCYCYCYWVLKSDGLAAHNVSVEKSY
jgi:hypothetical protein